MFPASSYGSNRLNPDQTKIVRCQNLAGFLADESGTLTVTMLDSPNRVLLSDLPVVAGQFYPMPIKVTTFGIRFEAAAGASGLIIG